jgi:hypothetical protein
MSAVPVKVQAIKKTQTDDQPKAAWSGPTANRPIEAVMEPHPLIRPVTVPRDLLLPRTEGCEAKSAATAEVIILLGLSNFNRRVSFSYTENNKYCPRNLSKLTLQQGYPCNQA